MHRFKRYAIYYLTQDMAFSEAGANWLGWDAIAGKSRNRSHHAEDYVIASPQKYGFHATLKAPFRLCDGTNIDDLLDDFRSLASRLKPITLSLELARLGRFFALVSTEKTDDLKQLASSLVRDLDHHRAPLGSADIDRRRPHTLNEAQRANLMQWGYPHCMDLFKFHMTLSSRLNPSDFDSVHSTLSQTFGPFLNCPHTIESICLVGENQEGYFQMIERAQLGE